MKPFNCLQVPQLAIVFCLSFALSCTSLAMNHIKEEGRGRIAERIEILKFHPIFRDKLVLRPIALSDYQEILLIFSDEIQMKYFGLGKTYSPHQMEQKIKEWVDESHATPPKRLFLRISKDDKFAGLMILTFSEAADGPTEIACMIAPSMQRQGLAETATDAAMEYFGGTYFATVHPDNRASIRALEKNGFALDPLRHNVEKYGSKRSYYTKTISKPKL